MEISRTTPVQAVAAQASHASETRKTGDDVREVSSAGGGDNNDDGVQTRAVPGADKSEADLRRDQQETERLKQRDREVRAHEQAHLSAAGSLAKGGANFTYKEGPDGQRYAVGGEVQLESASGSTPEETLQRATTIRAAALAPAQPSAQDLSVAASASATATAARVDIAAEQAKGGDAAGKVDIGDEPESKASADNERPDAATQTTGERQAQAFTELASEPEPDVAGVQLSINVRV